MSTFSSSLSDESALIRKASSGDLDAFNQLVLAYQDLAYSHACILLGDPFLAEDATQESFIKAFRNIRRFLGGSFRAWLLRIVTNTAIDMLRWLKRYPVEALFPQNEEGEELEPSWIRDPSPSVPTLVERRELSSYLHKMLGELPEYYRTVITLVDVHALNYTEAAEVLGVPIGTVKSRLLRARRQMREKLLGDGFYSQSRGVTGSEGAFSPGVRFQFS